MKNNKLFLIFGAVFILMYSCSQKDMKIEQIVDAACGQCQFRMNQKSGCDLAIRINSDHYFVEGSNIDEHGDPHSKSGLCNSVRKAKVKGAIKNGAFHTEVFTLLNNNSQKTE